MSAPAYPLRMAARTDRTDWSIGSIRRLPVSFWCFMMGVFFNIFSGMSQYMGLPVGLDRIFLPLAFLLTWLEPDRERLRPRPIYALMGCYTAWALVSSITAGNLFDPMAGFALLDRIVTTLSFFVFAPLVLKDPLRRDLFLLLSTAIGTYLSVTAFFEVVGPKEAVWPRYIMNPDVGIMFGRARGPFGSGEADGVAIGICMAAAIALGVRRRGPWLWWACALVPCSLVAMTLTMTRSVWLGALLSAFVVALILPAARKPLAGVAAAAVAAGMAAAQVVPDIASMVTERLGTQRSLYDRQNTNDAAWRIIAEEPLTGIGWNRFFHDGVQWVRQSDDYPITNVVIEVHNVFLSRAVELGVPAAVMLIAIMVAGPVRAVWSPAGGDLRVWRPVAVVSLCMWLVASMSSPNSYSFPNYLLWILCAVVGRAGIVVEPATTPLSHRLRPEPPSPAAATGIPSSARMPEHR